MCQHFWKYRPIPQNTDQFLTFFWKGLYYRPRLFLQTTVSSLHSPPSPRTFSYTFGKPLSFPSKLAYFMDDPNIHGKPLVRRLGNISVRTRQFLSSLLHCTFWKFTPTILGLLLIYPSEPYRPIISQCFHLEVRVIVRKPSS